MKSTYEELEAKLSVAENNELDARCKMQYC